MTAGAHPVSAAVLDAAIGWQLHMGSGEATPNDARELRRWLAAHAEHQRAWTQLGEIDEQLAPARKDTVRTLLVRRPVASRWKQVAGASGLIAALALGLGMVDRFQPVATLAVDYRTGTGERRIVVLPDRTVLHLDTRTAVDLAFDTHRRAIVLRSGEIAVETAHGDAAEQRPFIVLTPEGSLRALGTRFVVQRREEGAGAASTWLTVIRSAVAARPASCASEPAVSCAGERIVGVQQALRMEADATGEPQPAPLEADAWTDGMLVVENRTLGEVAAEIARYRPGHLAVDPRVAGLRVTGTLPLADTDAALLALTAAVPVDVVQHTRWWVRIVPRGATD